MPSVELQPMKEEEFDTYYGQMMKDYGVDMVRVGYWDPSEVEERGKTQLKSMLPQGVSTRDNYLCWIADKGTQERVGVVWYGLATPGDVRQLFIYDLLVYEKFRRKGYATEALLMIDRKARELGSTVVGLHVFAGNTNAVSLYEKLGYRVASTNMLKRLE